MNKVIIILIKYRETVFFGSLGIKMDKVVCLLLLVVGANGFYIKTSNVTKKSKIIGGEPVDISEVPYLVSIFLYI